MKRALIVSLLAVLAQAVTAHAAPAERIVAGARAMAGRKATRDEVVIARGKRVEIWVRPGAQVVGVTQYGRVLGFPTQRGFLLDQQGNLSAQDHAQLAALVARHAPHTTDATVDHAIARGTEELDARDRALVGQDPAIDGLLARIRAHKGPGELVLRDDGKRTLSYNPRTNVIVEAGRYSQRGFFLTGKGDGLTVAATSRDGLRAALASRRGGR